MHNTAASPRWNAAVIKVINNTHLCFPALAGQNACCEKGLLCLTFLQNFLNVHFSMLCHFAKDNTKAMHVLPTQVLCSEKKQYCNYNHFKPKNGLFFKKTFHDVLIPAF